MITIKNKNKHKTAEKKPMKLKCLNLAWMCQNHLAFPQSHVSLMKPRRHGQSFGQCGFFHPVFFFFFLPYP